MPPRAAGNPSTSGGLARVLGDQVGDACDPRPGTAGDVVLAFLPFTDPAELDRLTLRGAGQASIAGGQLVLSSASEAMLYLPAAIGVSGAVETRVHQTGSATTMPWGAGVALWVDAALPEPSGVICVSNAAQPFTAPLPLVGVPEPPITFDADAHIRFVTAAEGAVPPSGLTTCWADDASVPYQHSFTTMTVPTGVGVYTARATARFDHLFIVDSP